MKFNTEITRQISNEFKRIPLLIFKSLLLLYIIGISLIIDYRIICYGLDSSHFFATNYFFYKHIKFGPDVIWTYGPFGFLIKPVNIGHNLDIAIFFQVIVWIIFCSALVYFSLRHRISILQLCSFAFFFSFARGTGLLFDYFLCLFIIFFLSLSFFLEKWKPLYLFALFFSGLLWMIKFDLAFAVLFALALFIVTRYSIDRNEAWKINILTIVLIPFIFVVSYIIYNPSFTDMILYLKGAYHISSGYSLHSFSGKKIELIIAMSFGILYLSFVYFLHKARQVSFFIALVLIGPLFVAFKRGFVRQDTHVATFFSFSLVSLALIFLFTDIRKNIQGNAKQKV